MSIIRTRWAALGAAVAVTLGAGGIGLVSATNPGNALTFIAITPCRVLDTRVEFNVGPKASPMGPGEVHTVKTHGNNGNCTNIPATASAVSMNMTATDATAPTFLAVWATGATRPDASSLNPVPGAPPTPNAVTTELNGAGEFDIYNLQGSVDVFADINGYYVDHHHDDRYYTKNQSNSRYLTETAFGTTQYFPSALSPELEYNLDQQVTTTRGGRLLVTMSGIFGANCTAGGNVYVYLTVDDVVIANSMVATFPGSDDVLTTTLVGVTENSVGAGVHTIGAAAECTGASTASGPINSDVATSTATVLPT